MASGKSAAGGSVGVGVDSVTTANPTGRAARHPRPDFAAMRRSRSPKQTLPDHDVRAGALAERLRNGLWPIPTAMVVLASVLATGLVQLERSRPDLPMGFRGGASSAQDLLSTVAASTLAMATLVLSITIVALQLASQQFSPRVMRTFLRDTGTKVAVGTFLATTVYSLLVLRQVLPENDERDELVPGLAVSVAFTLALASLGAFVYYLDHVAHSIRAVHIMETVAAETRAAIRDQPVDDRQLAAGEWPTRSPDVVLTSERPPGSLIGIDEDDIVRLAVRRGVRIRMLHPIGDYLPSGIPYAEVWADEGPVTLTTAELARQVGLGTERTMRQDVAFGIRQLVDIAEKALSPAVNDPTTAVQAFDRLHDLLRRLGRHPDPNGVYCDERGTPRLHVPLHGWVDLAQLAFDEIRQYGGGSQQVQRRLRSAVADLRTVVAGDAHRVAVLDEQIRLLDLAAATAFPNAEDRARIGAEDAPDATGED